MKVDDAIKRALRPGEEEDRELKLAAYVLATEYTQLKAKLPKTADGVPVVPGENGTSLFYRSAIVPYRVKSGAWWDGQAIRCRCAGAIGTLSLLSPERCYSTREAAEAGGDDES